MENNNQEVKAVNETVAEAAETVVEETIKRPRPKKKTRTIEELENLTTRSMTEAEKSKYIEYLKEEAIAKDIKINQLEAQAKSAYERLRKVEELYENVRNEANQKITFIYNLINNAKETADMVFKGGK